MFSRLLLLFLISATTMSVNMQTQVNAQQNNPIPTQSILELQSQRTSLEHKVSDLEQKVAFWHSAVLVAVGLAAVAAVLIFVFQHMETRRTTALNDANRTISSVTEGIRNLEREAEATARRALEKRTLSQEQFRTISETLLSFPPRTAQVICPSGNQEAYGFAKQISHALEAAHWNTGAGTVQQDNAPQDTGITLFVREADSEGAKHLRDALAKAGIWSSINVRNPLQGIIRVYVGSKP
jgi:hypothetical protein